jgi:hypothetical protein
VVTLHDGARNFVPRQISLADVLRKLARGPNCRAFSRTSSGSSHRPGDRTHRPAGDAASNGANRSTAHHARPDRIRMDAFFMDGVLATSAAAASRRRGRRCRAGSGVPYGSVCTYGLPRRNGPAYQK